MFRQTTSILYSGPGSSAGNSRSLNVTAASSVWLREFFVIRWKCTGNYAIGIIYEIVIVPSPERRQQWCPVRRNLCWSCDQHKSAYHLKLLEPFFRATAKRQRKRSDSESFRAQSINWTQNICWLSRLRRVIGVECQKRQDNNLNG